MSISQFVIMALGSVGVTLPAVRFIPRARQSPAFDRVLWAATGLLAFLGAGAAPSYVSADAWLNGFVLADVAVVPMLIGAAVGALSINLTLWALDRLSPPSVDEFPAPEISPADEEERDGSVSTRADE